MVTETKPKWYIKEISTQVALGMDGERFFCYTSFL